MNKIMIKKAFKIGFISSMIISVATLLYGLIYPAFFIGNMEITVNSMLFVLYTFIFMESFVFMPIFMVSLFHYYVFQKKPVTGDATQ